MANNPSTAYPIASHLLEMPRSVYSELVEVARGADKYFPFHVGDTYLDPPQGCHVTDFSAASTPRLHHYTPVPGIDPLREALAERRTQIDGVGTEIEEVLVTAGVTGGLAAAIGAIVEPEDEVIVASPYWPLAGKIAELFHGRSRPAAIPDPNLSTAGPTDFVAAFAAQFSGKTRALYVNPVHNPTGWVLPFPWMEALADWARDKKIWILCDEVYEDFVYHQGYRRFRSLAPAQTLSFHSFSKAYAMAGNRVGYIVGPADALGHIRKLCTHLFYSAPTVSQWAALRVLEDGDPWLEKTRLAYGETAIAAAGALGVPPPMGGAFFFVDLGPHLGVQTVPEVLGKLARRGVLLAPGSACGPYPNHIRMCFTSMPPEAVLQGVGRVVDVLRG